MVYADCECTGMNSPQAYLAGVVLDAHVSAKERRRTVEAR
jgi:hypothetical protein